MSMKVVLTGKAHGVVPLYNITFMMSKNHNVKVSDMPGHLTDPKKLLKLSPLNIIWVTQCILCVIFSMYVTMKQPLSGTQFFKTQFADYVFDTPGILKQGHQSWYELVDPKQGSNHTKFERSCFKCPTILIFFFFQISKCQISPLSGIFMIWLM